MMKIGNTTLTVATSLGFYSLGMMVTGSSQAEEAARPNIIFIMSFTSCTFSGSEEFQNERPDIIETGNMKRYNN